jgi:hypothetical protein
MRRPAGQTGRTVPPVVPLRPGGDVAAAAAEAFAAVSRHSDAFTDLVGAEGAVTAWKRDMLAARSSPATVNQALAAVTLMYTQADLRISVKRARIPRPGEPDAATRQQEDALRRAGRGCPFDRVLQPCALFSTEHRKGRPRSRAGRCPPPAGPGQAAP